MYQFYAVHQLKVDGKDVIEHAKAICISTKYSSTREELSLKKHETHQLKLQYESIYRTNYTHSLDTTEQGSLLLPINKSCLEFDFEMLKKEENLHYVNYTNLVNDCRTVHLQKSLDGYYLSGKSTYSVIQNI